MESPRVRVIRLQTKRLVAADRRRPSPKKGKNNKLEKKEIMFSPVQPFNLFHWMMWNGFFRRFYLSLGLPTIRRIGRGSRFVIFLTWHLKAVKMCDQRKTKKKVSWIDSHRATDRRVDLVFYSRWSPRRHGTVCVCVYLKAEQSVRSQI